MSSRPAHAQLEGFGHWLFAETQGQPFYMIETLRALRERGLLTLRPLNEQQWVIDFDETFRNEAWAANTVKGLFAPTGKILPQGVREVIRARLAQLTPVAFGLLTAGAVLGHDFSFEQMCQVAALGENEALPALDEVVINRLLAEGDAIGRTFSGTYGFTHDKIRDVVYTEAGEARRRIFHRRALEALEGTATPAAELAHHALAAGLTEATFQWSLAAGDNAMKLFAVRDAVPHYEQARSLLAELQGRGVLPPSIEISTIQHLYLQLGRAYELLNETQQARVLYEEMLNFAKQSSSITMEQTALNHLAALTAQNPYELKQAATLLDQTLQVAGRKDDSNQTMHTAEEAETEWNLAQLAVYRFELTSALEHGENALTIARQLGHQELMARSLNVLGYALMTGGHWEQGEHSLEEAALLFRALGDRAMEVDSLTQAASSKINDGRPHAAVKEARTAYTISIEIENIWGQANSGIALAQGLLEIGAYAEAFSIAQEVVSIARTHDLYLLLYMGSMLLGKVHRAMLDPDAARAVHLELMGMVEPVASPPLIEALAAQLCADCVLAQTWEEALSYALQAVRNRTDFFIPSTKLAFWSETEALVHAGEIERAIGDVEHYGKLIGNNRRYRIPYLRALAVLAQYRNEVKTAIEHLQEAAQLANEIGLPGELWSIEAVLGEVHQQRGDKDQARIACMQAAQVVQSLAEKIEDEQLRTVFLSAKQVQQVLERF